MMNIFFSGIKAAAQTIILLSVASAVATQEYYVGRYPAAVVPKRMLTVPLNKPGMVEFCYTGTDRVNKGTMLVKINPEELALQEAEMLNQQKQNSVKEAETLLQLRRQKEELEFIMAQPASRRKFMESRFRTQADQRALDLLNERIAVQEEATRIANAKLQRAFDKVKEEQLISMPFDGRVQYHVSPGEGDEKSLLITQTGPLLTVVDDSMLYIAITPEESSIVKLPPEQLQLSLDLGGGLSLRAPWHHKKVEMRNRKESLVYYFAIAAKDREQAWEQVGANLVAELHYSAVENEELLSIHKAELAAQAGKLPFETWEELVAALHPDYQILFVGETHICLKKKAK